MKPSNKKKLNALRDALDFLAGVASELESDDEGWLTKEIRSVRRVIDDVLKREENK
mgnify:FL=1